MHVHTWSAAALALLATTGAAMAALAPRTAAAQADEMRALEGEWLYVEDVTEGRPEEERQPPMSVTFGFRVDEDAVVMLRGKGTNRREERIAIDGSTTEEVEGDTARSTHGEWKDGVLVYEIRSVRQSDDALLYVIRREFRATPEGLMVRVLFGDPATSDQLALYRHPEDIELPTPADATIDDLAWLAGAWTGTKGSSSIEERWSPPAGGAMLGVSRTVKNGSMSSFEYLRVVERGRGLVYVAQPGGRPPTEFVLTFAAPTFASFENPRHDSPQRIEYELSPEGVLTASIGFINGGRPQTFEFTREGD